MYVKESSTCLWAKKDADQYRPYRPMDFLDVGCMLPRLWCALGHNGKYHLAISTFEQLGHQIELAYDDCFTPLPDSMELLWCEPRYAVPSLIQHGGSPTSPKHVDQPTDTSTN
ncbi:hypothetical protein B0O99DRAFT_591083 [Bisporella sp. PMI_857]|nr:hypothetical protein B0O99DRAFT_591083 [Bisporella sp. PMI_857]